MGLTCYSSWRLLLLLLAGGFFFPVCSSHLKFIHAAQCHLLKRQTQSLRDWGDPRTSVGNLYSTWVESYPGAFYPLSPDYNCPDELYLGDRIDGAKWVCGAERLPRQHCVVYSFGSNGDFSFETELLAVAPQCEVHTFDPGDFVARVPKNLNVSYHKWGLSLNSNPPLYPLRTILRNLGHDHVDVLKVDVEGVELDIFPDIFSNPRHHVGIGPVGVLLLELHGFHPVNGSMVNISVPVMRKYVLRLRAEMLAAGFLLYHVEPNPNSPLATEVAYVNMSALPITIRPPCRIPHPKT
eukprot:RCo007897